jgi:hypothetical protein
MANATATDAIQPVFPLSTRAKVLTPFLLDGIALPKILRLYGSLFSIIACSAAVATSIYCYLKYCRKDRTKMQIAVFHLLRMIENLQDLPARLCDPHSLLAELSVKVSQMIGSHLPKSEAMNVMKLLRYKVWICVDEERAMVAKRQRRIAIVNGVSVAGST